MGSRSSALLLCSVLFLVVLLLPPSLGGGGEAVHKECRKEGMIAYTFDQGPSQYTGILLTALAQAGVRATFHVTPDYLDNPVLSANLRRAALEGHLIGLFVKDGIEERDMESYLAHASQVIQQYTHRPLRFLRFPLPGPSAAMLKTVAALGYRVSSYNLDSLDYQYVADAVEEGGRGPIYRAVCGVLDLIVPPTLGSFITVQRDIVQTSILQTAAILKHAKERGYKAVRLDECVGAGLTEPEPTEGTSAVANEGILRRMRLEGTNDVRAITIPSPFWPFLVVLVMLV